ncbi:MAG: hypothetical protein H7039_06205 [Bryobacteraceae bacterium]|nr:hypothetical protein [Bryobacteraceae bacterium]
MRILAATTLFLAVSVKLPAAGLSCPAGMPLGAFDLQVTREPASAPIPLNRVNQLEEGDSLTYSPSIGKREKRPGEVAVVLIASSPAAQGEQDFSVLEPRPANKATKWSVPFRSSLAMYVYGPSGLSTRKLRGFLQKDQELVAQLADYAEKTAQTEYALQALTQYENSGYSDGVGAALQGLAGQSASANKLDRTASVDQQTLAALRTLNPALSAYDPISPTGSQRVAQTTGLAATVAGMFLGSTVGLAAGSTAMALNLKTLLFPDTDFRSAYTQQVEARAGVTLCSARDTGQSRKRHAYLWAMRVPDSGPPSLALEVATAHIPAGLKTPVKVQVPEPQWKLVSRFRDWALLSPAGSRLPVQVLQISDGHQIELNLAGLNVPPGAYSLQAVWDWDSFTAQGQVQVHPVGDFKNVRITPETSVRLLEKSGKQIVTLEGADFQFVERATLVREGDKYASPSPVPFSLPLGLRRGTQDRLEMQVDTTNLQAGIHSLSLTQQAGATQTIPIRVLTPPPQLTSLPLILNGEEEEDSLLLSGDHLSQITGLSADGVEFALESQASSERNDAKVRTAKVHVTRQWIPGSTADLRMLVRGYPAPVVLANALLLAGKKPRIREVVPSTPTEVPVELRKGELLAGVVTNLLLRLDGGGSASGLTLDCKAHEGEALTLRPGSEEDRVKLQPVQSGTLFLSLDAGRWPAGCILTATLETKDSGRSRPFELGRVIRLPAIESFRLTDESSGEGMYTGLLTGRDLELIEKTGWDAQSGQSVEGLPSAIVGEPNKQTLKIRMPWPSPTPHSPLYVWFRGETEGRATTIRY